MAKKRRRTSVPTVRPRKPTSTAAVKKVVDVREYLANAVAAETNERRRRFMCALVHVVRELTPDEMDKIEPLLTAALGRMSLNSILLALPERV